MSAVDLKAALGDLWPYLVVIFVGFLPTEIWRVIAVVIAKDIKEDSELLHWVRLVASALLAAVVAKIVVAPPGVLQETPIWGRFLSLAVAVATLLILRRSVAMAVLLGEAALIAAWYAVH